MKRNTIKWHIGLTIFACIAWACIHQIRDGNISPREWASTVLMTAWLNLMYMPSHWHGKKQFAISFAILLIGSGTIFWWFEPISWIKWLIEPFLIALGMAGVAVLSSQKVTNEEK